MIFAENNGFKVLIHQHKIYLVNEKQESNPI